MKLEKRIKEWIKNNPDRSYAGDRMLEQLHIVRTEFSGYEAARLEGLVEETLNRQLSIDESRAASLKASARLADSIQLLKDNLAYSKKSKYKLSLVEQGIKAAAHNITTHSLKEEDKTPNKDLSFVPDVPKVVDKRLN